MNGVEKRKAFIINLAYYGILLGLFYIVMHYAFWPLLPFMLAFLAAVILQKPVDFITKKTPIKRGLASVIMVLLLISAFIIPFILIIVRIAMEFRGFFEYIGVFLDNLPEFLEQFKISLADALAFLPDGIEAKIMDKVTEIFALISSAEVQNAGAAAPSFDFSFLLTPLGGLWNTAKQIPTFLASIFVSVIACCFMTSDFARIKGFLKRQLPEHRRDVLGRTKSIVFSSVGKMVKSYLIIMLITFSEMFIGLSILKLLGLFNSSYIFVISLVTCVVDIIPVLGTGTILIPWTVYSFIVGDIGMGIGLLVLYIVITVLRQIIEPKLVAGQLGLPAFVTIVAMYFGTKLFGFIGLFLLPMSIIIIKILNDDGVIHLWKRACDVEKAPVSADVQDSDTSDTEEKKE